jgi:hypothetical protein
MTTTEPERLECPAPSLATTAHCPAGGIVRFPVERAEGLEDLVDRHRAGRSRAWRNAGAASTAQASEAQEARTARFSLTVKSASATTSRGCANACAGCNRSSRSSSNGWGEGAKSESFIATSCVEQHGYEGAPAHRRHSRRAQYGTRRRTIWFEPKSFQGGTKIEPPAPPIRGERRDLP